MMSHIFHVKTITYTVKVTGSIPSMAIASPGSSTFLWLDTEFTKTLKGTGERYPLHACIDMEIVI